MSRITHTICFGVTALTALAAGCSAPPTPVAAPPALVQGPVRLQVSPSKAPDDLVGPMALTSCVPPTAAPTPSTGASAPGFGCDGGHVLSGIVYDRAGLPSNGAMVLAVSQDASVPYTATAKSFEGRFVFNNLPLGATVKIYASKDDWVSSRFVVQVACGEPEGMKIDLRAEPTWNVLEDGIATP